MTTKIVLLWYSKVVLRFLDNVEKSIFRRMETISKKIKSTELHQEFNEICLNENLHPKYTNFKTHDATARTENFVLSCRTKLVQRQVTQQKKNLELMNQELCEHRRQLKVQIDNDFKYEALELFLERIITAHTDTIAQKHDKKLFHLYGGNIFRKQPRSSCVNLSNAVISDNISEIFSLGMNCHLKSKYDQNVAKIEIEKLYNSILQMRDNSDVIIDDEERIKCELKHFGMKERKDYSKSIISKEQYAQIKEFTSNSEIIVRKADKSNTFVVMNRTDYYTKINEILKDETKFVKIEKDPTYDLKSELNKLIAVINSATTYNYPRLTGHFEPGYVYGNPKIHKNKESPPLRPIVSQVGTVTYDLAKWLNSLITSYMPKKHMIDSTYEFIQIARTINKPKFLASLDVESLFTNVPVIETIRIILDNIYDQTSKPPLAIPRPILEKLLTICTTKTPFRAPTGEIYQQTNGVSMGSALGPTFANFYMCHLENSVFHSNPQLKPHIYCRYVDDIFLVLNNFQELIQLKTAFETCSILQFTYETEVNKQMPFLDTLVHRKVNNVDTSTYTKATNSGDCMNFSSHCPNRYKIGVIKNFLHRSYQVSSTWQAFTDDLNRIRQLLVNNNFPNSIIEKTIAKFINSKLANNTMATTSDGSRGQQDSTSNNMDSTIYTEQSTADKNINTQSRNMNNLKLYYRNQMTASYKQVENELHKIISTHVKPTKAEQHVQLLIFYRNRKLRSLFIRNNSNAQTETFNVVYKYTCNKVHSNSAQEVCYIGCTRTTLKDRMKQHAAIKKHHHDHHNCNITGSQILPSVTVITKVNNPSDLHIMEALIIQQYKPIINTQSVNFIRTLNIF